MSVAPAAPDPPELDIGGCHVLVVDDDATTRELLRAFLEQAGLRRITLAADGDQALAAIAESPPDLVVLDILMPGRDGRDVLRVLREQPRTRQLPVLVQTALDSAYARSDIFAVGATDLIVKPVNRQEFLARIRIHLENLLLVQGMRVYQDQLQRQIERLGQEMAAAREMQQALLPDPALCRAISLSHGLDLEAFFEPSSALGGDIWGVRPIDDRRIALYLADFSGHGVNAAINTFRLDLLMRRPTADPADGPAFLGALGRELARLLPRGQFATMLYLLFDVDGAVSAVIAGAPGPVVVPAAGPCRRITGSGLPLGLTDKARYEAVHFTLAPGESLLLHSDCFVEQPRRDGTRMTEDAAMALVEQAHQGGRLDLKPLVAAFDGTVSRPLADDLTLVRISRPAPYKVAKAG